MTLSSISQANLHRDAELFLWQGACANKVTHIRAALKTGVNPSVGLTFREAGRFHSSLACTSSPKVAEVLLNAGADPNGARPGDPVPNMVAAIPLELALRMHQTLLVQVMLTHGASLALCQHEGWLSWATGYFSVPKEREWSTMPPKASLTDAAVMARQLMQRQAHPSRQPGLDDALWTLLGTTTHRQGVEALSLETWQGIVETLEKAGAQWGPPSAGHDAILLRLREQNRPQLAAMGEHFRRRQEMAVLTQSAPAAQAPSRKVRL